MRPKAAATLSPISPGHLANLVNGNDSLSATATMIVASSLSHCSSAFLHRSLVTNRKYSDITRGRSAGPYPPPNNATRTPPISTSTMSLDRPIGARGGGPSSADSNLATSDRLACDRSQSGAPPRRPVDMEGADGRGAENAPLQRQARPVRTLQSQNLKKCLDAANRPYAEVLRLGLCPKEWLVGDDTVGVNTLKSANAFLKILKAEMNGEFGRRPDQRELDVAFFSAPIPGYKDAKAFTASLRLGRRS